ncbi:hypothetical protein SAMN05216379_10226 [Nitrosomonas eutropha]|nr:hypothetical protein SAMN05216379_10226 [Nitrosomonas eutropha]
MAIFIYLASNKLNCNPVAMYLKGIGQIKVIGDINIIIQVKVYREQYNDLILIR